MKNLNQILLHFCLFGLLLSYSINDIYAQGWERKLDGQVGYAIASTSDNGFLITGAASGFKMQVTAVNAEGMVEWNQTYEFGQSGFGHGSDIIATSDGNFLVGGESLNDGGKAILMKIDGFGNQIWKQEYTDSVYLEGLKVRETQDGNYLLLGVKKYDDSSNATPSDIFLIKTDTAGNFIFKKTYGNPNELEIMNNWLERDNGELFLWGKKAFFSQTYLMKLSPEGDSLWSKTWGPSETEEGMAILEVDTILLGLYRANMAFDKKMGLLQMDLNGNVISNNYWIDPLGGYGGSDLSMIEAEGDIYIAGDFKEYGAEFHQGFLIKSDLDFNAEWQRRYGDIRSDLLFDLKQKKNGGFAMVGANYFSAPFPYQRTIYLVSTDFEGVSITNEINGQIHFDSSDNCVAESNELLLENWVVKAEGDGDIYHGLTDSLGNYTIQSDSGEYYLTLQLPNAYWDACFTDSVVNMSSVFDTLTVDFAAQAAYDCPILNVDISTPYLRRCFDNTYYVSYCNEGTVMAEDASVEVSFDEFFIINSSSITWTTIEDNTYTFEIGNVPVGVCSSFEIDVILECDGTVLGQTHCVSAHVLPDSICLPENTLWDGSSIIVEGECLEDTIEFRIRNVGDDDMSTPLNYIVIEDHVIHHQGSFQLMAGATDTILQEATGATYRLEAQQSPFHPLANIPTATVEGCNDGGAISFGFVNNYSDDDVSPFYSDDCQESIGSFDPNDKRGFPEGIGDDHLIFPETELEYHIRFQNTGTDTAFTVVIRDTLSTFLDLTSLRIGASSHPYEWDLVNGNMLKFTFDNIMLPDSNVNEAASHGFVKFKIGQMPDNLNGTLITNRAGIYFDFNEPIITNTTEHLIGEKPTIYDTIAITQCNTNFYQNDTSFVIQSSFSSYETVFTHQITIDEPDEIFIDTFAVIGTPFEGVFYENDTLLVKNLINQSGCDSTVFIQLNVLIDNLNDRLEHGEFTLYPNPFYDNLFLNFYLKESEQLSFILQNQLGETVQIMDTQQYYSEGSHIKKWHLTALANGVYFLKISHEFGLEKSFKIVKME